MGQHYHRHNNNETSTRNPQRRANIQETNINNPDAHNSYSIKNKILTRNSFRKK